MIDDIQLQASAFGRKIGILTSCYVVCRQTDKEAEEYHRYYAEEMAFWANYGMLRTYPGDGIRGSQGILQGNEVRGFGWHRRHR